MTRGNDERLGDCQSKRQVDRKGHALAGFTCHFDAAAQRGDFAFHHIHAYAPAGHGGNVVSGGEAGLEDHLGELGIGGFHPGREQAKGFRLGANFFQVEAGPVVLQRQHDFVAFLPCAEQDFAEFRLACGAASLRVLQAMNNGVAQQVFQGRSDLFQNRAIKFKFAIADVDLGALAQFARGLPDDPVKPFRNAVDRHHPHAQQILLQFPVHSGLLGQGSLGFSEAAEQGVLDGGNVVYAFRDKAGNFLKTGKPVQFQRVEFILAARGLEGCLHLGFSLDFNLPDVGLEAIQGFGQFHHMALEAEHFAFDARTGNRNFTSLVDHPIHPVDPDP